MHGRSRRWPAPRGQCKPVTVLSPSCLTRFAVQGRGTMSTNVRRRQSQAPQASSFNGAPVKAWLDVLDVHPVTRERLTRLTLILVWLTYVNTDLEYSTIQVAKVFCSVPFAGSESLRWEREPARVSVNVAPAASVPVGVTGAPIRAEVIVVRDRDAREN
eukprot:1192433-Prorocentrum_minimum.AAC.3